MMRKRSAQSRQVLRGLARMYGDVVPPRPYRGAGLDALVEAMLSQNTSGANARDLEAERVLAQLIPTDRHYETHILLFQHAKKRCRPKNPKCEECALLKICPYGQRVVKHLREDREADLAQFRRGAKRAAR